MSKDSTVSSTSFAFTPSLIIVKQYGHPLPIMVGFVQEVVQFVAILIRVPVFSSVHIIPPPAPQHMAFSRLRALQQPSHQESTFKISRGGS